MHQHLRTITVAALVLAAACGSSSTTSTTGNGSMSATIAGTAWSANLAVQATHPAGILSFAGVGTSQQINIVIQNVTTTGTYQLGAGSTGTATLAIGAQAWVSSLVGGTGSVVVTTLTATHAVGTFSFTGIASPNTGATGNKVVTSGAFDVTF